jgi:hypothetical protein
MEALTIPEGLDLVRDPSGAGNSIRRVWRSWKLVPLGIFACFWCSVIFSLYYRLLSRPHPDAFALLFPMIHLGVGVGLIYFVVASFLNTTEIQITPSGVRVATGPVPWSGNKRISASDIRGVMVRERRGNRGAVSYAVVYADPSGKEIPVATLSESDQADFVCRKIQMGLGLKKTEGIA